MNKKLTKPVYNHNVYVQNILKLTIFPTLISGNLSRTPSPQSGTLQWLTVESTLSQRQAPLRVLTNHHGGISLSP